MSTPIKQNTTELQEILDLINDLPEAGGVGSDADMVDGLHFVISETDATVDDKSVVTITLLPEYEPEEWE